MASKPESPTIEWRDDAKPLALCMMCNTEFPTEETRCPQCQSALSLVHRCPGCSRFVSAKHLRCPYCSQGFLKNEELGRSQHSDEGAVSAARRQMSDARLRGQGRRALWFSGAVFLTVFVLAVAVQRYRPGGGADTVVLGSSFVLHEVVLRESGSSLSPALGKMAPPAVVAITGTQQDVQGGNWFQIQWGQGTAYIPVSFVAPPKGNDADGGYKLLRISLIDLSDPGELEDAASAVKLYRNRYPADPRGEELLWLLAEKGRELGLRRHDPKALATARGAYSELSRSRGQHASDAAAALAQIGERSASTPEAGRRADSGPGAAEDGAPGSWGIYSDKTGARKVLLLDRTEVSVVLSAKQTAKDGEILTGQISRAVVSNGDTVIPAGAPCRVKVNAQNGQAGKSSVELSLVEIQIGGKSHPVEAAPVRLDPGQSLGRARVSFRLRQSLILAQ